jgi:hypothetical protein
LSPRTSNEPEFIFSVHTQYEIKNPPRTWHMSCPDNILCCFQGSVSEAVLNGKMLEKIVFMSY